MLNMPKNVAQPTFEALDQVKRTLQGIHPCQSVWLVALPLSSCHVGRHVLVRWRFGST
jgi:hypothetical protein